MALGKIKCSYCKREFETENKYINRVLTGKRKAIYCSKECQILDLQNRKIIKCDYCGKEIEKIASTIGKYNFCSSSCSAKFNNPKRATIRNCEVCGMQLKTSQKKYCSKKCETFNKKKRIIEAWLKNEYDGMRGEYGLSSAIRNYLLEKVDFKCEQCGFSGINPSSNKTILEIHHVDGDYKNNRPENLKVLCPNCHAMSPSYRSNNKNGRKGRNKYSLK